MVAGDPIGGATAHLGCDLADGDSVCAVDLLRDRTLAAQLLVIAALATAVVQAPGTVAASPVAAAPGLDTTVDWGDLDLSPMVEIGDADPATSMTFYVGMVTDVGGLTSFARTVSDPASASYGGYPSVAEVAERFGASAATEAAVVQYFAPLGIASTVDPTGVYATVTMTLAAAETTFGADWRVFTPVTGFFNGLNFLYPATTPVLPTELRGMVSRVHGAVVEYSGNVSAVEEPEPAESLPTVALTAGGGTAYRTGTASGCAEGSQISEDGYYFGMTPKQLLEAYGIDSLQSLGLQGQGTRVAIIDDALYEPAWLEGYRACFGLSDATAVTPHVVGAPDMSEADETILDLSVMSFVAPKVDRLDVFMVQPALDPNVTDTPGQLIAMFGAPLDASQTGGEAPDVVSASFGACEALQMFFQGKTAAVSIMESVLASAVAAGVSYLVATGDSGSSACLHALSFLPLPPDPAETVLSAQYPSTSAWVTAVGGTNLTLDDGNEIVSSGVWNDQAYELTTPQYLAGTGGTSTMVARPWYQASGVPAGSMRVVPDVAAFADALPGYSILGPSPSPAPVPDPGVWQPVGGTSAATPLLAGATLLLDQLAMQRGQPTLGFWNPLLYTLASGGTSSILDITLGTDDLFGVGCCSAATGFDLASGWGSPLIDRLAGALANPALAVAVSSAKVGESVTFTAAAVPPAGQVASYSWDLSADGTIEATSTTPTYTSAATVAGVRSVRVTATTDLGRSATAEGMATVSNGTTEVPIVFAG
jgi:subtilase family serine protease